MHKKSTVVVESLPALTSSEINEWYTISNQGIEGKNKSLIPYWVRYELTEDYLHLKFEYQGESKEQIIPIVFKESNLGQGKVWYMKCPKTSKLCRKLVLWRGFFVHQSAILNIHYFNQTVQQSDRPFRKMMNRKKRYERISNRVNSKYSKWTYRGNLTHHKAELKRAYFLYMASFEYLRPIGPNANTNF